MKTITLEFELQQGNYKLITNDNMLQGFDFSVDDLLKASKAEDTQSKLEYILYRKRNEVNVNDSRRNV
jgi:hypothetical protein